MEEINAIAAAEAIAVLNHTDISLLSKVPYSIVQALETKAAECTEEVKLDLTLSLNEQQISEDAKVILTILYKDFLCSEEEEQKLNERILENEKEYNKELEEKYNPFKDSQTTPSSSSETSTISEQTENNNIEETSEMTALIEKPKKWYFRIFDKIVKFFRKK